MKQNCLFHSRICTRDYQIFKEFIRLVLTCLANHVQEGKDEFIKTLSETGVRVLTKPINHTIEAKIICSQIVSQPIRLSSFIYQHHKADMARMIAQWGARLRHYHEGDYRVKVSWSCGVGVWEISKFPLLLRRCVIAEDFGHITYQMSREDRLSAQTLSR